MIAKNSEQYVKAWMDHVGQLVSVVLDADDWKEADELFRTIQDAAGKLIELGADGSFKDEVSK